MGETLMIVTHCKGNSYGHRPAREGLLYDRHLNIVSKEPAAEAATL